MKDKDSDIVIGLGRDPIFINGNQVLEYGFFVRPAICENDSFQSRSNAITFKNEGNTTVRLDDELTIRPGASFIGGDPSGIHVLVHRFNIRFLNDAIDVNGNPIDAMNRLEIVEVCFHHPKLGENYKEMNMVKMKGEKC